MTHFSGALTRRRFLGSTLATTVPLMCGGIRGASSVAAMPASATHRAGSNSVLEHDFLNDLRHRCYRYFVEAADPATGLISDRGRTDGSGFSEHASSAACGFALASYAIAPTSGLDEFERARERSRQLLRSLTELAEHHQGFVYHFIGRSDGVRRMNCEASTVDTALMLAGVICSETTFGEDQEIAALCEELVARVNWQSMLGDGNCLHMGWTPEQGRLPYQWDRFSELTILVLMAIGAPRHAIDASAWDAWRRDKELSYRGESFLSYPPLFVHQYPMAFFDFRNLVSSSGRSYWQNSITAHRAQLEFLTQMAARYPETMGHYGENLWGITSSDSASGYRDWGGPYEDGRLEPDRGIDGTVVPSAAAGGLAIVPEQALATLRFQRDRYGDQVYGRYGFTNAFNPATGWVGPDVIGIDTGISLLMAENQRSGGVWKAFMNHPLPQRAFELAGFRGVSTTPRPQHGG